MRFWKSKKSEKASEISDVTVDLKGDISSSSLNAEELNLFNLCMKIMDHANFNLYRLEEYKGSAERIRMAIMNPNSDVEHHTWEAIKPIVHILKDCYLTSIMIEDLFPVLLDKLSDPTPEEGIRRKNIFVRITLDIILYIYNFDSCKMNNPDIQNDFSYYRRMMNRRKLHGLSEAHDAIVSDDIANHMSLFFANPNPLKTCMAKRLKTSTRKLSTTSRIRHSFGSAAKSVYFGSMNLETPFIVSDMNVELCPTLFLEPATEERKRSMNYENMDISDKMDSRTDKLGDETPRSKKSRSAIIEGSSGSSSIHAPETKDNEDQPEHLQKDYQPLDLQQEKLKAMINYFSGKSSKLEDGDTLTRIFTTGSSQLKSIYRNRANPVALGSEMALKVLSYLGLICLNQAQYASDEIDPTEISTLLSISTTCVIICDGIYSDTARSLSHEKSFPIQVKTLLDTIKRRLDQKEVRELFSLLRYSSISFRDGIASSSMTKLLKKYS